MISEYPLTKWLTRAEAADMLGVSTETIANWERNGKIHSKQIVNQDTFRKVLVYDPQELMLAVRRRASKHAALPGERTARAFELFRQGATVEDVVIEIRETVGTVQELFEQWQDICGKQLIVNRTAQSELEALIGPFTTIAELVRGVRAKLTPEESR